jgi:hypothetical protein
VMLIPANSSSAYRSNSDPRGPLLARACGQGRCPIQPAEVQVPPGSCLQVGNELGPALLECRDLGPELLQVTLDSRRRSLSQGLP